MSNIEIAAQKAGTMVAKLNGKQKLAFSFGIVVALAVALPVLTLAFAAVTNLFGLIVFGLATLGLLVATPMLLRKWKNKVLGFMISEAQANPILTLRNQSLERHAALDRAKKAASGMVGKINSLADDLAEFKEKHRKESGSRKIYDRMLPIVQSVQDRIKKAEAALSQFDLKIEEKSDEWDIMLKAGALKKALKDAGATDPLELILADAA
ncbi:MAG: hypothetical protein RLZZ234_452, partial [Candidatus Parcubacteria bacterium]